MAQWIGQFTGNSHATKIKDLEETLEHAVSIFLKTDSDEEKIIKGRAVSRLAEKLLTARLKSLKAQLNDAEPVMENKDEWKRRKGVETLRQQEAKVRSDGVNGILREFGAQHLII